ncbi:MAG: arginine--tRNA ligase [Bacteroidetes bacterium]|nr:arginine--tRNA ligase [Bacteroidota bacterium]
MTENIKPFISDALKALFDIEVPSNDVKLEITNKDFEGDFTFVVFPYLRQSRKNPVETATLVGEYLEKNCPEIIDSWNVVKGFLNLSIPVEAWLKSVLKSDFNTQPADETKRQKVMVEYSSPNTNKPLHLGHVRNNLLGYSICRILEAYGHEVIKVNLINDRGIHICKSMLAYAKFGHGESPAEAGMKGDHFVGKYYVLFGNENKKQAVELMAKGVSEEDAERQTPLMEEAREWLVKWEEKDPEIITLWEKMNNWVYEGFNATYKRMGVSFDKFYHESETYVLGKDIVEEGLSKGVFYKREDGSVWINLTDEGLDEKLLLRKDGTSVYMTQDLGTADLKYQDYKMNASVYVVGNEQDYHFKVLKSILQKLGRPYADGIFHMSYGMVELPEGKLKTREGKVVDADNLMDEMFATAKERTEEQGKTEGMPESELHHLYEILGLGAMKYFLLKVDPLKRILFNPNESIDFQGNTATFIQYTHARCRSILRNGKFSEPVRLPEHHEPSEKNLLVLFTQYFEKLEEAADNFSPSVIANYMYEVAKSFNTFYNQCPILRANSEDQIQFRLYLTLQTANMLKRCGELLGIEMPSRM